ncbi:hypothetical protein LAC81_02000 [Ensifer adhaerens]|uniref:hypothetical protein n=1 Tax=Ensifer adhaerens TaxID=106592 RepID=UPI001CBE5B97|nr:hypothetical protein [Ensifer adhaerens]MBZ7920559.1 hypothetical protein [Ensifer adhaerens]UAX93035.1 hypothetical protein LAC78_01995 [Ensifer adhaerens]UAY00671.1 hypothetical protein LAC80_02000 [Ensifer adhaerens]UAY08052.1 hypothetical protein LAC81_02000 [Ensifer adhaerens]
MAGFLFGGDTGETAQSLARKRDIQDMLARQIMGSQPKTAQEGIGALLSGIGVGISRYRTDKAQQAGTDAASKLYNSILGAPARSTASAPSVTPGAMGGNMPKVDSKGNMPVSTVGNDEIRSGIISSANALGIDPVDLATAISYETAGTFDPTKKGPKTQWGQHQGFLQFGEPQAKEHGVDWNNPVGSQLGENGAVVSYLRNAGVKPGMGMMDIYSAINAGSVGRYGASDANNGGAPGTVADKVNNQMAGHRQKALALIGQGGATVGEPMAYYDDKGMSVESRQPAFSPDAQTRPAGNARATVDATAPRNAAEAVTAMAGGNMPATSPFVSPFVDPHMQSTAAAGQAGASLSDEVAAFEQTPEYAARFPGRKVSPSFPGKETDDMAVAALPQPVNVGANPVPPNSQPVADGQIPAQFAGSQQLARAEGGIMNALNTGTPATPQQIAQAVGQQPAQVAQSAGGVDPRLYEIPSNGFATPEMKAVARTMLQQQMGEQEAAREEATWRSRQEYERQAAQNDPLYRIKLQQAQNELEGGKKQPLINAGNGNVYDPNDKTWITPPGSSGSGGAFRFGGNSVEAQALNGLMDSGALTPSQAQQLGAGKTISGPNGELIFLTPQGVFGTSSQAGGAIQPITPNQTAPQGSNSPQAVPQTTPEAVPQAVPQAADQHSQSQPATLAPGQIVRDGNIQLTEPKVPEAQKNRAASVDQAYKALNTELDRYSELVEKTGIEAMPGQSKDQLNSVRQGVMLQLKELFNLGVLNGPDLSLMERMIYDPVIDPFKEGGVMNLPDQLFTSIAGNPGARAKSSVDELKRMIGNIRNSVTAPKNNTGGDQSIDDLVKKYGG